MYSVPRDLYELLVRNNVEGLLHQSTLIVPTVA